VAILLLVQSRWRASWRSLISLSVLLGVIGGMALGATCAALRTSTALTRMEAESQPYDVIVSAGEFGYSAWGIDRIRALPQVKHASSITLHQFFPTTAVRSRAELESAPTIGVFDDRALYDYMRPIVKEGRLPKQDSPDEVFVEQFYADAHGLKPGDALSGRTLDSVEMNSLFNGDSGTDAHIAEVTSNSDYGTPVTLTVSGVGTMPDAVLVDSAAPPVPMWGGPKSLFVNQTYSWSELWASVWLKNPADIPGFEAALNTATAHQNPAHYSTWASSRAQIGRAIQPAALALWIFAGITVALGLLLFGQAVSRRLQADGAINWPLWVVGATHRQRTYACLAFIAPALLIGSLVAVALAFASSWLTPIGLARVVETSPGPLVDGPALSIGAIATVAMCLIVATVPAWRSTRITALSTTPPGSTIAAHLARWGAPPPTSIGVRFALEPGQGRVAVPTRATIVGAVTAITVAVASLTFAASLATAVTESQYYGVNFDGAIQYYYWGLDSRQPSVASLYDRLRSNPGVAEVAVLRAETVSINGQSIPAVGWVSTGSIEPTIAEGRAPRTRGEVALGQLTLESLGAKVGDRVDVQAPGFIGPSVVVGRAVLPGIAQLAASDSTSMGFGAVMTDSALGRQDPKVTRLLFTVHPGVDVSAVYQAIETNRPAEYMNVTRLVMRQPADVVGLRQLRDVPLWLAGGLIIVVAATVVHALFIGVRRRRTDLAVLHVLGAEVQTLRRIGLVQGVTVVLAASVVGIPLGVIAGRWSWTWVGERFGTIVVPVVPWSSILIMAAVMAALAGIAGMAAVRRGLREPSWWATRVE
jgi:hypothetical protein